MYPSASRFPNRIIRFLNWSNKFATFLSTPGENFLQFKNTDPPVCVDVLKFVYQLTFFFVWLQSDRTRSQVEASPMKGELQGSQVVLSPGQFDAAAGGDGTGGTNPKKKKTGKKTSGGGK